MKKTPEIEDRKTQRARQRNKWHRYNLIPTKETAGVTAAIEAADKMLCLELADGRTDEFDRLYRHVWSVEVYELDGLKRAYHY